MKKKFKYSVGDEVEIVGTSTLGVIKELTTYLGDGNNIYKVDVYGRDRMYSESSLTLLKKKNVACLIDAKDLSIRLEIQEKISNIIEALGLKTPQDEFEALDMACSLHAYLAITKDYEVEKNIKIGKNVNLNTLYHGLMYGNRDIFSASYLFSEVLRKINMDALNVAMEDENGELYISNLVLIGRRYFYFDVNLETEIFDSILEENPDAEFVFTCAGLGRENYEKFFTPLSVIDYRKPLKSSSEVPLNISDSDICLDLVTRRLSK